MEEKIQEVKYEFEKLCMAMPMSDAFWLDAYVPALKIAQMSHFRFVEAIITWRVAKRRLAKYRWPATWRDAFKERWFPAWAKRRWPIRYRKVSIDELIAARARPEHKDLFRYFIEI